MHSTFRAGGSVLFYVVGLFFFFGLQPILRYFFLSLFQYPTEMPPVLIGQQSKCHEPKGPRQCVFATCTSGTLLRHDMEFMGTAVISQMCLFWWYLTQISAQVRLLQQQLLCTFPVLLWSCTVPVMYWQLEQVKLAPEYYLLACECRLHTHFITC